MIKRKSLTYQLPKFFSFLKVLCHFCWSHHKAFFFIKMEWNATADALKTDVRLFRVFKEKTSLCHWVVGWVSQGLVPRRPEGTAEQQSVATSGSCFSGFRRWTERQGGERGAAHPASPPPADFFQPELWLFVPEISGITFSPLFLSYL